MFTQVHSQINKYFPCVIVSLTLCEIIVICDYVITSNYVLSKLTSQLWQEDVSNQENLFALMDLSCYKTCFNLYGMGCLCLRLVPVNSQLT